MFPLALSTAELLAGFLVMVGYGLVMVGSFGIMGRIHARWVWLASLLGLAVMSAPLAVGVMANHSSFFGALVIIDRDRAVEVVAEAKDIGVSDFTCLTDCGQMSYSCMKDIEALTAAARDRHQSQVIKSLAGISG